MRKIINLLVVLGIIGMFGIALIPEPVSAMTGSGTEGDPYMIYDVDDLQDMANNLSAYYELANDIDASATLYWNPLIYRGEWQTWTYYAVNDLVTHEGNSYYCAYEHTETGYFNTANWIPTTLEGGHYLGWSMDFPRVPSWPLLNWFEGSLDGNGHSITNLYINRPDEGPVGLIGFARDATIKNVNMVNVDITANSAGALLGSGQETYNNPPNLNIINCSSSGSLTVYDDGGGLIGGISGVTYITNCRSSCTVAALYGIAGGLCGQASYFTTYGAPTFTDCYAIGDVFGIYEESASYMGGFVGTAEGADYIKRCKFIRCYATGVVYGHDCIGGFIGMAFADCEAKECYATGAVYSDGDDLGGFAGYAIYGKFTDCYTRGDVSGIGDIASTIVGGFIGGASHSTFENCYSTGRISEAENPVGGFAGYIWDETVTACFWDIQTSGLDTSDGGTGKTTAQMKTESTFTNAGWDFDTIWGIAETVNDGYPCFLWQYFWAGDFYQVVWFQPNYIIQGTELPNRTGNIDGVIHWGANPEGITISLGELIPEEEYNFEPIIPSGQDIIKPEPEIMTGDVDTERLHDNPLYPLVQVLTIPGFLTERLAWLGLAWFIVIAAMFGVHLGFDTRKDTEKPQHFILTSITGLGLSILFYRMGIFPYWVIIMMALGLIGAIIWERQPVL